MKHEAKSGKEGMATNPRFQEALCFLPPRRVANEIASSAATLSSFEELSGYTSPAFSSPATSSRRPGSGSSHSSNPSCLLNIWTPCFSTT